MASASALSNTTTSHDDDLSEYRSMSSGAVAGLVLGGLSLLTIAAGANSLQASLLMAPIPLVGIFVSFRAMTAIRRMPTELAGCFLARFGFALSIISLIGGVGYGAVIHATEVPDGYARLDFCDMKPTDYQLETGVAVPPEVMQLDGCKVFIKGFMRPSTARSNLTSFLFVQDNKTCCFGAIENVKYHDQIQVELVKPKTTNYMGGIMGIGGKLHVHPENAPGGRRPPGVYRRPVFTMTVDYIK